MASKARSSVTIDQVQVVLVDIEGTVTPISFVKEKLFPLARTELRSHLVSNWESAECQEDIRALCCQCEAVILVQVETDLKNGMDDVPKICDASLSPDKAYPKSLLDAVLKNVLWHMDSDRKTTALKQLQGHVWSKAYADGKIKGEVFGDVVPALKQWTDEGLIVGIYSSGSIHAQKLLFGHSQEGNLLKYISVHFDTTIGNKREKGSYSAIAKALDKSPEFVLFCTDIVQEAEAAHAAGMQVVVTVRPGNAALSDKDLKSFPIVEDFTQLTINSVDTAEPSRKRARKAEEQDST